MGRRNVIISVPTGLLARAATRPKSLSAYVTDLITADFAKQDMCNFIAAFQAEVGTDTELLEPKEPGVVARAG
jgi:hypothetical protein